MRYPKPLKKGDTIGLVAPSFGAATEPYITRLASAVRKLEEAGYEVLAAPSCYKGDGLGISTDPASAAKDLENFYLRDDIDALISVGGGELMCETISHVHFKRLGEAKPKWFMGYSDNTNFLMPMATMENVAGIYGPCATGLGKVFEEPEKDVMALLTGNKTTFYGYPSFELPENGDMRKDDPLGPYALTEKKELVSFVPEDGKLLRAEEDESVPFSGMLLGGCLDVLTNLAGTEYDNVAQFALENEGIIWVLEACDLNPMAIRRAVWNLVHCGWFETAAGFLIGRSLTSFRQEMMGVDAYNAYTDLLAPYGVPVVMDADIGHVAPMMPIVIGAHADVAAKGNDLRIDLTMEE